MLSGARILILQKCLHTLTHLKWVWMNAKFEGLGRSTTVQNIDPNFELSLEMLIVNKVCSTTGHGIS